MQGKLNIQADTVQQLIVNEKLQEQVAGRVIIVDEAGLLSIKSEISGFMHALDNDRKSGALKAMKALQSHWAEKNSRRKALNPSRVRRKFDQPVATAA